MEDPHRVVRRISGGRIAMCEYMRVSGKSHSVPHFDSYIFTTAIPELFVHAAFPIKRTWRSVSFASRVRTWAEDPDGV